MREYERIWRILKANAKNKDFSEVVISCPMEVRGRVRKAVQKEKDMDRTWPQKRYYKLQTQITSTGVTFKLVVFRWREISRRLL